MKIQTFLYKKHTKQSGAILPMILGAMFIIGCVAVIGTSLYTTMSGGMQKTSGNVKNIQILNQAADVLTAESTKNSSGFPVMPPVMTGASNPIGGGIIPSASNAPKGDTLGTTIGYCIQSATDQNSVVMALISSGPNKTFDTTCTQALNGLMIKDDIVITKKVSSILQSISGIGNYAEPVNNETDLGNLPTVNKGEIRLVLSTKTIWTNVTGTPGMANWAKALLYSNNMLGPMPVAINDPLTTCNAGQTRDHRAKEGFSIDRGKQFLYLCSNGSWHNGVVTNGGGAVSF